MTKEDREMIVASHLNTPAGKKQFRAAFMKSCAEAADHFPEGSLKEGLCRILAGMAPRVMPPRRSSR